MFVFVCVFLTQRVADQMTPEEALSPLQALARLLQAAPWPQSVHLLDSAKVPVIKLVTRSKTAIDVSFETAEGHSGLHARSVRPPEQAQMSRPLSTAWSCIS